MKQRAQSSNAVRAADSVTDAGGRRFHYLRLAQDAHFHVSFLAALWTTLVLQA